MGGLNPPRHLERASWRRTSKLGLEVEGFLSRPGRIEFISKERERWKDAGRTRAQ